MCQLIFIVGLMIGLGGGALLALLVLDRPDRE